MPDGSTAASETANKKPKPSLREQLYMNRLYKNNTKTRFFNKKAAEMGQLAFDDDFKKHLDHKYIQIANGSNCPGVIAQLEREEAKAA